MTELEVLKRAQMYIESLAKGIDPLTGQAVKKDDVVNNLRISKCLFYVSDVLCRVIDNGGEISSDTKKVPNGAKVPFGLTPELIESLVPEDTELSAAKITAKINALIDTEHMQKLTATAVTAWLEETGLLYEIIGPMGKKRKLPTSDGEMLGLRETAFTDPQKGNVKYIVYNKNAQQFIFDNLEAITQVCLKEAQQKELLKKQKKENKGSPWTQEDDEQLIRMFIDKSTFREMENTLKRTRAEIKARMAGLGLLEGQDVK